MVIDRPVLIKFQPDYSCKHSIPPLHIHTYIHTNNYVISAYNNTIPVNPQRFIINFQHFCLKYQLKKSPAIYPFLTQVFFLLLVSVWSLPSKMLLPTRAANFVKITILHCKIYKIMGFKSGFEVSSEYVILIITILSKNTYHHTPLL